MSKSLQKAGKIGLAICFLSLPLSSANSVKAEITTPQVYMALGDSIAAGATPYNELDAGYTDIIAAKLSEQGLLAAFSKDFAVPGFAADNILDLLDEKEVRNGIEQATLITLSAGANNVLGLVQQDPGGRTVQFNQMTANFILNQMRIQYGELLDEIQMINPTAEIYAVGYYFPYPNVLETQQQGVRKMLSLVNEIIQNEAENRDITFIDVAEQFDENGLQYVPNPTDVHPNQLGYLSMANSFFDQVTPGIQATEGDIPPNPGMSPFLEELMNESGMTMDEPDVEAGNEAVVPDEESTPEDSLQEEDTAPDEVEDFEGAALGPKPAPSLVNYSFLLG
ncbi:GDSL-type esterase/lipase family protein [Jeotgalibacillus proteolyticus]|uniref:Lysophospholipase n=1 Tax=Jeotgalibacillus proteolyticus TaxID=2082395 RepID=A0A2S5GFX8_9BACL|nr:GDSL-type esterase/lipase family protein [Jeotgalibacillus proteolyticus]PPA71889.1 lysophospholipase [Jeotgalibacillus proteolyticus]